MSSSLSEHWYIFWGIAGTIVLVCLHVYARNHLERQFANHWNRLHYAGVACAVFGAATLLLDGMLQGFLGVELLTREAAPYVFGALLVVSWFVAPYLRRVLPVKRGEM